MKPLKLGLRIWIAFTAAVSFLTGWVMLAHAGKPAPDPLISGSVSGSQSQSAPLVMPTLPPVPSLNDLGASSSNTSQVQNLQPLQIQSAPFSAMSGLRTRGS